MGSDASSTECRFIAADMGHCFDHTDRRCCGCNLLDPREQPKPCTCGPDEACGDPCEECQHPNKQCTGRAYDGPGGRKHWVYYSCPDCKKQWKEEEPRCKGCGHTEGEGCGCPPRVEPPKCNHGEHPFKPYQGHRDAPGKPHCLVCGHVWGACSWHWVEEPPMTPEEEEQAPEDEERCAHESWEVTGEWSERDANGEPTGKWWKSRRCADCKESLDNALEDEPHWDLRSAEPPPPQPERRPPLLVSYSVQGHLYQVALSGDAIVSAVDGALVIKHPLGFVAGICHVEPFVNKEGQ